MNFKRFLTTASVLGLSGMGAFAPSIAFAQDSSEDEASGNEIIVTAQRREEKSVDVPITVTTLSADALTTANVDQLSGIAKMTPGLRFDFAGAYFQPTIRGVGTPVTSAGSQGNVGIYVDGFYVPNPLAADFDLMKVRSIQVLKGPQGTLFGRNTTGGAILVQTADPSTTTAGQVKLSYGRYNEFRGQGYATFGLSERVAMDVEGQYRRGDGYLTNISNNKRVGDYENWSARVGLKAELSDSVSVMLRYQHSDIDDPTPLLTASYQDSQIGTGYPYFATPGQFTFSPDQIASGTHPSDQEYYRAQSDVVQGTIKADLGFADLTSYSQYRKENADASIELDYSGNEFFQLGLPNDNETFTQEFLLTSKPGTKLQWTAGLFYFQNRDTYRVFFDYFPAIGITSRSVEFGSSATAKSYAAFLDMTYEVTPKLFITAGARYAYDKVTNSYAQCAFCAVLPTTQAQYDAVNGGRVTPRVVVRYKPTDETSVYASYTRGYKSAILDFGRGVSIPVKPEVIDAFEVGFKLDNSTVSFETSAFYYDYKNLQVSLYETGTAVIINAANSEIYGLDAQFRWRATDHFQLNGGAAWVHARYKQFNSAPVYQRCLPAVPAPADFARCGGNTFVIPANVTLRNTTMQRTPEFTANLGATYKADLGGGELALSGNLFYTSSFFFGPSGIQFKQDGYEVLALRAQWTDPSDKYTIAVFGDNVTNKRYKTQVQYALSGIGANWSKPATWGIELGAKF